MISEFFTSLQKYGRAIASLKFESVAGTGNHLGV